MSPTEVRNTNLIAGCIAKDPKAQKTLFDTFAPTMYAICFRYAKNSDQAKDLLQDGFIKVFTKLGEFKFEGSFEGWLKRIFINHSLEYIRKEMRKPDMLKVEDVYNLAVDDFQFHNLDANKIMTQIQKLPTGYRTVINLFIVEGFSHKEIANLLGISENTSKTQLHKGRQMLQKRIKNDFQ